MFSTKTFYALKQSLDGLAERQRVISANIANVNTPGYKARMVTFEEQLSRVLDSTQDGGPGGGQMVGVPPVVRQDNVAAVRVDGNTTDIDQQMAELADTSLRYEAAAKLLARKYSLLRTVIMEGRR